MNKLSDQKQAVDHGLVLNSKTNGNEGEGLIRSNQDVI